MKSALEIIAHALGLSRDLTNVSLEGDEVLVMINDQPYAVKVEAI